MALIGKIRGTRLRDGKSISEISRLTKGTEVRVALDSGFALRLLLAGPRPASHLTRISTAAGVVQI